MPGIRKFEQFELEAGMTELSRRQLGKKYPDVEHALNSTIGMKCFIRYPEVPLLLISDELDLFEVM